MLTPVDIDNYAFKRARLGGYDIDSVEEFMEMLSIDYETLYKENQKLKEDIEKVNNVEAKENANEEEKTEEIRKQLEKELREKLETEIRNELEVEYSAKHEDAIREVSIVKELERPVDARTEAESFEEMCESVKTSAYIEAEEILRRANEIAATKTNEIDALIKEKKTEYEELKKQIQLYKIRFEAMLQTQLKLLNNPEFDLPDKKKK